MIVGYLDQQFDKIRLDPRVHDLLDRLNVPASPSQLREEFRAGSLHAYA